MLFLYISKVLLLPVNGQLLENNILKYNDNDGVMLCQKQAEEIKDLRTEQEKMQHVLSELQQKVLKQSK
jgi:hypothetical protein